MRQYGRDPSSRYYEARNGIWGTLQREAARLARQARRETASRDRRDHSDRVLYLTHLPEQGGQVL